MSHTSLEVELFDPDVWEAALMDEAPIRKLDHPTGPHSDPDMVSPGEINDQTLFYAAWLLVW